jgi:hypothetical protein
VPSSVVNLLLNLHTAAPAADSRFPNDGPSLAYHAPVLIRAIPVCPLPLLPVAAPADSRFTTDGPGFAYLTTQHVLVLIRAEGADGVDAMA